LTFTPSIGKPIKFFLRASSGNALVGPISLATDASQGILCRFLGTIHWGTDPWLVQLGETVSEGRAAERLSSIPEAAQGTTGSMVSDSSPGFVSKPKNAQLFQVAAGVVEDHNSGIL
jgi:hypothetical protein